MARGTMQGIVCPSHGHSHGMNLGLRPQCPRLSQGIWAGRLHGDSWRKGVEIIIGTGWCHVCPTGWCRRCVRAFSGNSGSSLLSHSRSVQPFPHTLEFKFSFKPWDVTLTGFPSLGQALVKDL